MPPSTEEPSPKPTRKTSSSALLGAVRGLTGGRSKLSLRSHNSSASSPSSTRETSQARREGVRENTTVGGNVSEPTQVNGVHGPRNVPEGEVDGDRGKPLGGPPELRRWLSQLDTDRSVNERISAVRKIALILESYPVRNVLDIISAAISLLHVPDSLEAHHAGYTLLCRCAKYCDLSSSERRSLFQAISERRDPEELTWRVEAIECLTNGARNIDTCEAELVPLLTDLLQVAFPIASAERKRIKKPRGDTEEEQNLANLFNLVYSLTKFNAKVLRQGDLERLTARLVKICKRTTVAVDVQQCLNVIEALITFSEVPRSILKPILEILCDVYRQLEDFKTKAWKILENIFRSHLGAASVVILTATLSDTTGKSAQSIGLLRGAATVLQVLVLKNGSEDLPVVPLTDLISAMRAALAIDNFKLALDMAFLLVTILSNPELTEILLSENDWSTLTSIMLRCYQTFRWVSEAVESGSKIVDPLNQPVELRHTQGATIYMNQLTTYLNDLVPRMGIYQKDEVVDLFRQLAPSLSDAAAETMVKYYAQERLLYPLQKQYVELATSLMLTIFAEKSRPRSLRMLLLGGMTSAFPTVEYVYDQNGFEELVKVILTNLRTETDPLVLGHLTDFGATLATEASNGLFDEVLTIIQDSTEARKGVVFVPPTGLALWTASRQSSSSPGSSSLCNILVRSCVCMFMRTINTSAYKAKRLFAFITEIARSNEYETDSRISALKLLFRLRADATNAIYVSADSESAGIAGVLCRTVETAVAEPDTGPARQSRVDEPAGRRESRSTSSSSPRASTTRSVKRSSSGLLRTAKPVPPFWMYPGPKGLPEEPAAVASSLLYSAIGVANDIDSDDKDTEIVERQPKEKLDTTLWADLVVSLLKEGADWEVYSYALVHAAAQLSNRAFFDTSIESIGSLQALICDQIRSASFLEPPAHTSLKRADVAVRLFHILTVLMSYHSSFRKETHDEMVKVFALGLVSWDRTSKWAIHALSVSCHELPLSTSKCLDTILQKMSTIITQPQIAIHILEFLASLARLPELYKNFRDDEYKTIFGICFRYLQYVRDQRDRQSGAQGDRPHLGTSRNSMPSRELQQTTDQVKAPSCGDELPQYVYSIAYHVVTFWFLALKLPDRPGYMNWIAKSLAPSDQSGQSITEEQSQVTIDLMQRVAFTERDDTNPDPEFAKSSDGEVLRKSWIVGMSLLTVECAGRTGVSQIAYRRPSGTRYATYRPLLSQAPSHQTAAAADQDEDSFYTSNYIGMFPDDILQALYSPLFTSSGTENFAEYPVALPEDDATRRAISAFDRSPEVDSHKVGVIYIGEGQNTEAEIFANTSGSLDYSQFIPGLGALVELKGASFNTHGLDREFGSDGEFTFAWRDRVTEMVFHITTLMPTNLDNDPQCVNKKKHTGNDFVNVVFNDSGQTFDFNMFPSAFNYVYIVISPVSRTNPAYIGTSPFEQDAKGDFYRVQVISKEGFPQISPAAEPKIMSARSLPGYVRLLALNASFFSHVWSQRDGAENISSWRNRLREIKKLRDKHCPSSITRPNASPTPPATGYSTIVPPTPGAPGQVVRDSIMSVGPFKRASAAALFSEPASRNSMITNSADTERQGSDG